ncbi:MAG: 50S ribosomal protein L35 [Patescibacteria group bacterium]|nr:50S ribosomal protein L35 [Patescibacteria group bacterium]
MPKLKTSKSAAKRIARITKNKKIIRRGMSAQHLTSGKSKRTKSRAKQNFVVSKASVKHLKKLLPNLK